MNARPLSIHHSTSQPFRFFGRTAELALLDDALQGGPVSVAAFVGPGGQGKTAIVQEWLDRFRGGRLQAEGVFLWSFYRAKDAELCLRALHAYAEGLAQPPEVSASYCVDRLLPQLRRERWALILDGTEVVQYDNGPWFGRLAHPELARLIEELAAAPMPGVLVLTTRFPVPGLSLRKHARTVALAGLDADSARGLLGSLGVHGSAAELDAAAALGGWHAKAVELLGTYLVAFHHGQAAQALYLPAVPAGDGYSSEEQHVARVLGAFQAALGQDAQDMLALATAFRNPPAEPRLCEYLLSRPVQVLLHQTWGRTYVPFAQRPADWLPRRLQELIELRLLERVSGPMESGADVVIDAHPLVRRGFEHVPGAGGLRASAQARAGFLRGRPDRRRPATLDQAREEVELFHAYSDAHLWNEADGVLVALENPKHRFLAPAFERDLLLRFFPEGDWRRPPLWSGFGRYRSLAICCELFGQFEEALAVYREADHPLRGDALLALGRLCPLLAQPQVPAPWQNLWQAYRTHALCLAGRTGEAIALARSLVPVDIYEWVHVFECLARTGQLAALDLRSLLFQPPLAADQTWAELARRRLRADYLRLTGSAAKEDLGALYKSLIDEYDRGGLPYERGLTRLSQARWLIHRGDLALARSVNAVTLELAGRYRMSVIEADAWETAALIAVDDPHGQEDALRQAGRLRRAAGYHGPGRP